MKPSTPLGLLLEDEHQQLRRFLDLFKNACEKFEDVVTCDECSEKEASQCENGYVESLGNLIDFACKHFASEESLMKASGLPIQGKECFLIHVEDHDRLMNVMASLARLPDNPNQKVKQIKSAASVISDWLSTHFRKFDMPLVE